MPLDESTAREGGVLSGRVATADIVDAVVVVTADRTNIKRLASAWTVKLRIFTV